MNQQPKIAIPASGPPPGDRRVHELKTHPDAFSAVYDGRKRYEIRRDDRGFEVGDVLRLREFDPSGGGAYTGRECYRLVVYKTPGGSWGLPDGLCVLSLDDGRCDELLAKNNEYLEEARAARRRVVELQHACDMFVSNSAACAEEFDKRKKAEANLESFREKLIAELKILPSCSQFVLDIVSGFQPR